MPARNNIVMQKFAIPKRFALPDGRVFYIKYERIKRANLPQNVRVQRTYRKRQGRRRAQRGCGIKSVLKKAYNLGKKVVNLCLGKRLIREGKEYAPTLYR